jgi:hypothetical protein
MRQHAVVHSGGVRRMLTHGGSVAEMRGALTVRTDY